MSDCCLCAIIVTVSELSQRQEALTGTAMWSAAIGLACMADCCLYAMIVTVSELSQRQEEALIGLKRPRSCHM